MPPTFPIHAVADRTGLTPHVIRAWERRYRAIEPERSAGGQRMYSESEIERLAMLSLAVRSGHSIAKIAALPNDKLRALATGRSAISNPMTLGRDKASAPFRESALEAIGRFDTPALEDTLRRAHLTLGHMGLLRLLVAPLAQEIGEHWRAGTLTAAHEHFFTAGMKLFLGDMTRQFVTSPIAPCLIVTTPAGQFHELGAVICGAAAASLGWRVIYLGAALPAYEIAGAALRNAADAVVLSIVYPEDDPDLPRELSDLARLLPATTRILAGGRAARAYFDTLVRIGVLYSDTLEEYGAHLDSLRTGTAAKGTPS